MNYRTILKMVTPSWRVLILILALLLVGSALSLANPWIAGLLTEALLNGATEGRPDLRTILLAWFGLVFVKSVLSVGSQYLIGRTGEAMLGNLRSRLYDHLQLLPMRYFHERSPGETMTLLTRAAELVSYFVTNTLLPLIPMILTLAGAMVMMYLLDPVVTLLAAVLMPVYYVAMKLIGRRLRPLAKEWVDAFSRLNTLVEENIIMLSAIKAFVREKQERERFAARNHDLISVSNREIVIESILGPAITFLSSAGLLLLLWIGIGHVESGELQTSDLVSLVLYAMLLTRPISGLAGVYGQIQSVRGAVERLQEFLAERPEPRGLDRPSIQIRGAAIQFKDVCFSYPGREPVLTNFNLAIGPGETIALTGANGSGKSTLVYLLMRYDELHAGKILIDAQDIAECNLSSLREQIGVVSQNTLLVNASVGENIAYGRVNATRQLVENAAVLARADTFIRELPDGYDTIIGDQGIKLSGGQRQRLSLARTLLKDPPILVLDEATAMFDLEGERDFVKQCRDLLAERTVILITHRPASLSLADRILTMGPNGTTPIATVD